MNETGRASPASDVGAERDSSVLEVGCLTTRVGAKAGVLSGHCDCDCNLSSKR